MWETHTFGVRSEVLRAEVLQARERAQRRGWQGRGALGPVCAAVWVLLVSVCLNAAPRGVSLQAKSGLLALGTHRAVPSQYPC